MSSFFRHQGIDFRYELIGRGTPFAFCHGLTGDLEHPRQLLGELPGWQLILWDCRLHGSTSPDDTVDPLTFATLANDLSALFDHLEIRSAVIGGVSMGAGVATRFAADQPERTRALVLVRPAWLTEPHPPNLAFIELIGAKLQQADAAEVLRRASMEPAFLPAAQTPEGAETLRVQCLKPLARERSLRLRSIPASAPLGAGELSRLSMPTLVIGNDNDAIHPMPIAEWWTSALGARAVLRKVPSKSIDLSAHEAAIRREVYEFIRAVRN